MKTFHSRKTVLPMSVAILALMISFAHSAGTEARETKSAAQQKSIAELQQERLAVLDELVIFATNDYQNARAVFGKVVQAQQQLLEAQLEIAENHESRLKALKKSVELATQWQQIAEARKQAGRGTETDVLQSKANRLKAEIALHREQQKPE